MNKTAINIHTQFFVCAYVLISLEVPRSDGEIYKKLSNSFPKRLHILHSCL